MTLHAALQAILRSPTRVFLYRTLQGCLQSVILSTTEASLRGCSGNRFVIRPAFQGVPSSILHSTCIDGRNCEEGQVSGIDQRPCRPVRPCRRAPETYGGARSLAHGTAPPRASHTCMDAHDYVVRRCTTRARSCHDYAVRSVNAPHHAGGQATPARHARRSAPVTHARRVRSRAHRVRSRASRTSRGRCVDAPHSVVQSGAVWCAALRSRATSRGQGRAGRSGAVRCGRAVSRVPAPARRGGGARSSAGGQRAPAPPRRRSRVR